MNRLDIILKQNKEIKDFRVYDVDTEWRSFMSAVGTSGSAAIIDVSPADPKAKTPIFTLNKKVIYLLSAAACLTLVVASIFLMRPVESMRDVIVTADKPEVVNLVDGSKVFLGKNSSIEFPTSLDNITERKVILKGKARFAVSENDKLPFNVYYGDVFVQVLGTIFNVSKVDGITQVENLEGSVKVGQVLKQDNFVILKAGDVFQYQNGNFKKPIQKASPVLIEEEEKEEVKASPKKAEVKEKAVEPVKEVVLPEVKPAVEEFKGSIYKLESIVKGQLLKYSGDKVKLDKKSKLDMNLQVKTDITKPYTQILDDLKNAGAISVVPGECEGCFIIKAPDNKK